MNPVEYAGAASAAGEGARAESASGTTPAFRCAAILGTGLIGGSVAAALRARELAATIRGYAPGEDAARARDL
ncbi:MAG: hypothetical protein RIS35_3055, partial [Pseudomonadota bacterium]